jgi:cell division protease FtsH
VLDHLASDLVEVEVMDSDHLKRILDQHNTGPQIKPGTFVAPTVPGVPEESEAGDEPGEASGA